MRLLTVYICLAITGCGIVGPTQTEMTGRVALNPIPAEYSIWYRDVQSCVGESRDFGEISWSVATRIFLDDEEKAGVFQSPNKITIHVDWVHHIEIVKHEMVHFVRQAGDRLHRTDIFDRCAR